MVADKRMAPTTKQEMKPWKNGLVTFVSFILFGFTTLLSFIILIPFTDSDSVKFVGACLVSALALALALLGVAKARIASQNYMFTAMTLFTGAIAAAAYFLGWSLKHMAGLEG